MKGRMRLASMMACILAVFSAGLLPSDAASTWYVFASAASGGNGTSLGTAFKTIGAATAVAQTGDTILVYYGTYPEQVTLTKSVTLEGAAGSNVVISGMGSLAPSNYEIWTSYSGTTFAPAGAVETTVAPFKLKNLYFRFTQQPLARIPDVSQPWAVVSAYNSTTKTITLAAPLGINITTPMSAFAYIFVKAGNEFVAAPITSLTNNGLTVQLTAAVPGLNVGDTLVIANHPSLIRNWQDCAYADNGNGTTTVWWDQNTGNLSGAQSSLRAYGIYAKGLSNVMVENVEVAGAVSDGIFFQQMTNSTIQNCLIHDNGFGQANLVTGNGIFTTGDTNTLIKNCEICNNQTGLVSQYGDSGLTISQCEFAFQANDGMDIAATPTDNNNNTTIQRCYIHGNTEVSHPDCIQTWGYNGTGSMLFNLKLDSNFLGLAGGQNFISFNASGVTVSNNVICASSGYQVLLNDENNCAFTSNTYALAGIGTFYPGSSGNTGTVSNLNGVFYYSGFSADYVSGGVYEGATLTSSNYDYFWDGSQAAYVGWVGSGYVFSTFYTSPPPGQLGLSAVFTDFGLEANHAVGTAAGQQFMNVPIELAMVSSHLANSTTTSLVLDFNSSSNPGYFKVNDVIEVNGDGVARTVSAVDTTTYPSYTKITFSPALSYLPANERSFPVWDWPAGTTNLVLDFRPIAGSTILTSSNVGGQVGSTINTVQYAAGSFDGTGTRNIPAIPASVYYNSYKNDPYDGP